MAKIKFRLSNNNLLTVKFVALIIAFLPLGSGYAVDEDVVVTSQSFERSSGNLVLEYEQLISLLGLANTIKVAVFGDGSVEIVAPRTSPVAGFHRTTLGTETVDRLVSDVLSANQIASVQQDLVVTQQPTLQSISDDVFSTFRLSVDSFQDASGNTVLLSGPISITAKNISAQFLTQEQFNRPLPPDLELLRGVEGSLLGLLEGL